MDNSNRNLILFCSILDFGKAFKAMKVTRDLGAMGGTIFLGRGTIRSGWLNLLGATDIRKEIFISIIDRSLEDTIYDSMEKTFHLKKPNHGIAFSVPLNYFLRQQNQGFISREEGDNKVTHEAIFVIVDKGVSEQVIEAGREAGSSGGTVIHGRGYGKKEKEFLFNIEIEPEKDIILILSKKEETEKIVKNIKEKIKLDEPGVGILFAMDVSRTLGLFQAE